MSSRLRIPATQLPTFWTPIDFGDGYAAGALPAYGSGTDMIFGHPSQFGSMASSWFGAFVRNQGGIQRPDGKKFAEGGRTPGAPSMIDTLPALLAAGEVIINAQATSALDRRLGRGWENAVNDMRFDSAPGFAGGGRAGGGVQVASRTETGEAAAPRIIVVNDWNAAVREAMQSSEGRAIIVNSVDGSLSELGLMR